MVAGSRVAKCAIVVAFEGDRRSYGGEVDWGQRPCGVARASR